jgi:hypothetical protein
MLDSEGGFWMRFDAWKTIFSRVSVNIKASDFETNLCFKAEWGQDNSFGLPVEF